MWQIHLIWVPNLKNVTLCFTPVGGGGYGGDSGGRDGGYRGRGRGGGFRWEYFPCNKGVSFSISMVQVVFGLPHKIWR